MRDRGAPPGLPQSPSPSRRQVEEVRWNFAIYKGKRVTVQGARGLFLKCRTHVTIEHEVILEMKFFILIVLFLIQ